MKSIEGWFDIHNHMLPGVDDGAKDWEMSKKMLKKAYQEGVRKMIVTPHYHVRYKNIGGELLLECWKQFQKLAYEMDESFEVYLGNELYYDHDAAGFLETKKALTMADSRYVLTEFSPGRDFSYIKNAVYNLQAEGYLPIIAHIERYECMVKNIDLVDELYDMGVYIQVNASSIAGETGRTVKKFTRELLKNELVHLIGTDAHDTEKRPPKMRKCAEYIMKKCDEDYAKRVLFTNAEQIIKNDYI